MRERLGKAPDWGLGLVVGALLACGMGPDFDDITVRPPGGDDPPECRTDLDCEDGRHCALDRCGGHNVCECRNDSDCRADLTCVDDCGARTCRQKRCQRDEDCAKDAYCDGTCVSAKVCESAAECPSATPCNFPYKSWCETDAGAELPGCSHTKKICTKPQLLECGAKICPLPPTWGLACCVEGQDQCGLEFASLRPACQAMNQPGVVDPTCPDRMNGSLVDAEGCCRPDGFCGTMQPVIGCTLATPSSWRDAEPPRRCRVANDAGLDGGAGADRD